MDRRNRFEVFASTIALLAAAGDPPAAESAFSVKLPPHRFATDLLAGSPFGINTAPRPEAPDLEARRTFVAPPSPPR